MKRPNTSVEILSVGAVGYTHHQQPRGQPAIVVSDPDLGYCNAKRAAGSGPPEGGGPLMERSEEGVGVLCSKW